MNEYDVLVIGGGAAGLSGALVLSRALRSVLVIDAGEPRNAPAAHMHGFLSRDGLPPGELLAAGRAEIRGYGGEIRDGRVLSASRVDGGFIADLAGGGKVRARRLLVTTGLTDELPDVEGLAERWGRDVLHCPYCHGREVAGQRVGVLATGPAALHQAGLFRQWTSSVTLLTNDALSVPEKEALEFAAREIAVVPGKVGGLVLSGDRLTGVRLADRVVELDALVVGPRMVARSAVLASLGLDVVEDAMGAYVPSERDGRTAVEGVWAAGNVTDLRAQVLESAAAGARAAASINGDLIADDTARAVAAFTRSSEGGIRGNPEEIVGARA